MKSIIQVDNYTKSYGDFMAVDHISFEVEEGSIFGFLGPNGAGKSTTINTLCTLLEKTSGTLTIDGHDVTTDKNEVRESIGIVFQEATLDEKMTVQENLEMHCVFYRVPKKEIQERIDFVMNMVDLAEWKGAMVSSLSGGMKRRVEITRALLHNPKVLFLDEPTTGLDPQTRNRMWEYIVQLQKEKNITIFLTTHYMEEAEICDQVAIIDNGKIMVNDHPEELKRRYTQDEARVTISSPESFKSALTENGYKFRVLNQGDFEIDIDNIQHFLSFLDPFQKDILNLEIKNGTLNDVFLEITGKKIREEA
ncbi:ATP-binding cassette domain-containing protein [Jeotgalibaca sp. MA1X17-3]|uniref:ABC transporter ATP-binding protein n=1 Tax=Jeotgalibaca sp. MA1X17-3 TaxID=2908211 RepID=UPI001F27C64E|nr:ATP-binding cassette domain-containing protein [Jeotgalibaca sp. MA1X17-3]UJF15574.1 ATP-binding cassette domain-containing protein [Jeotgalibaca sp. MA1X17-3]